MVLWYPGRRLPVARGRRRLSSSSLVSGLLLPAMVALGLSLLHLASAYTMASAGGWLGVLSQHPPPPQQQEHVGGRGIWERLSFARRYSEVLGLGRPMHEEASLFVQPRSRRLGRLFQSMRKVATTTLLLASARERVHISSTRPEDERVSDQEGNEPRAIACLSYELGPKNRSMAGGEVPRQGPPYNGSYYYLGGNAESFLTFVQQELGAASANMSDIVRVDIADIASQKERFSELWREGRLVVADPNTLDLINNKTSFRELLLAYTTRMKKNDEDPITDPEIVSFLSREYGAEATADAFYRPERSAPEAMASLKALLEWFRQRFPYYKSTCLHCNNNEDNRLIGVAFPSKVERGFNATLTEVYVCSKCHKSYRFPRSVGISRVMETRRGRCGEYSRLFFKAMEALQYRARWVVDWEDHVWVEVDLPGRGWIHLDPCEAAVDEPLLYQSWGKNQTYILAFTRHEVKDVTHTYTSDFEAAKQRRRVTPQEFDSLLDTATVLLRDGGGEPAVPPSSSSSSSTTRLPPQPQSSTAAAATDRKHEAQSK